LIFKDIYNEAIYKMIKLVMINLLGLLRLF